MKISVLGLGYVGTVSAACLAEHGHEVAGVDVNPAKVELINRGRSPVVEPGLGDLVARLAKAGRLRATTDAAAAVQASDISIVCVPTPSRPNGSMDLRFVETVSQQIGAALKARTSPHVVVIRSTVTPGTLRNIVVPALEGASGRCIGNGFGVCVNPEFLREGTAIADFLAPPKTVIGATDPASGDTVQELYDWIPAPMIRCSVEVAELLKAADNAWHATKVVFANEIGNICKRLGIDSHAVMNAFCADTKLNLSSFYLKPGFAFGGSCLPKDLRALIYVSRSLDQEVPLLSSVVQSNRQQIERGLELIMKAGGTRVGLIGLSFKAGTDDLRESPLTEIVERLVGKGFEVRIYDPNVSLSRLIGSNRDYLLNAIPHIERLLVDSLDEVVAGADVVVIGNRYDGLEYLAGLLQPSQRVVDLVRAAVVETGHANYEGICW